MRRRRRKKKKDRQQIPGVEDCVWDVRWRNWEKQLLVGKKSFSVLPGSYSQSARDVQEQGEPQRA